MRHEGGFTLLEVLVAMLIAGAMLAVLVETALTGVRTVRDAGAYETAIALTRSRLAMLGRNPAEDAADQHGSDGPFDWRVRITPEAVVDRGTGIVNRFLHRNDARVTLYAISVVVSWRSEGHPRELRVDTKRLGFVTPPQVETP
jgi:prepilin-type N-terminal cleavage/methylation domain-containing protein